MAKYTEMARGVLTNVGGIENITFVEHCATRLRIHYKSKNKVDVEALKTVDRVVGLVEKPDRYRLLSVRKSMMRIMNFWMFPASR